MNWIPIVGIAVLLALAGWWWWANYAQPSPRPTDASSTLHDLKQGAKANGKPSRLFVKANGQVVSE